MALHRITTPLDEETVARLRAGDRVLLSGVVYTARDAAHRRLVEAIRRGDPLPFELKGQVIYYAGPSPAPPGRPIGSIGPTTSGRMDPYTIPLLELGLKGMIGKGRRSGEVKEALKEFKAVYFAAIGGAAALYARHVVSAEVIAYEDLGPEAIRRLVLDGMPLFVVNDIYGGDLYEEGVRKWRRCGTS